MSTCKIILKDEVNVKIEGLDLDTRKKLVSKFKYELPYARHMPAFKLGRWDGTVSFFGLGGTTYLSMLDRVLPIIEQDKYEIELVDLRTPIKLEFEKVTETYWADKGKV